MTLPNPLRGEVAATINGQPMMLRLTLGALAGLERAITPPSLFALLERFEGKAPSLADVLAVIGAAMPTPMSVDEMATHDIAGGVKGAYSLAAQLLVASFGDS